MLRVDTFEQLANTILTVDSALHAAATKAINQTQTVRNWLIGGYIVEYEQQGKDRAQYGDRLLKRLEKKLNIAGLTVTLF